MLAEDPGQDPFQFPVIKQSRAVKASERLAGQLARSIIESDLPDGARLPQEREMLEQLRVARSTLREALRIMEVWGILAIRTGANGGPEVRRPDRQTFRDQLELMLYLRRISLAEVLDARVALEPQIARLAANKIGAEELDILRRTVEVMSERPDDARTYAEANHRFHSTIAGASGSSVLHMVQMTLQHIDDGALPGVDFEATRIASIVAEHARIVEALDRHDPDDSARAMYEHVEAGRVHAEHSYARQLAQPIGMPETH
jgi:GntR family transcriptional regulator, transcriptional repressor for pyruvate dehydrogenase complex